MYHSLEVVFYFIIEGNGSALSRGQCYTCGFIPEDVQHVEHPKEYQVLAGPFCSQDRQRGFNEKFYIKPQGPAFHIM